MSGGLLNLQPGARSELLSGDGPKKTFFSHTGFAKHTPFGLQKIRLDYDGSRDLRLTEPSEFTFKVARHADLLMDVYLGFTIPHIWSPVYPPCLETGEQWAPYEFKWIEQLGAQLIREVEVQCAGTTISRFSGEYIAAAVDRDFSSDKQAAFDKMTGNVAELNRPERAYDRINSYPSAIKRRNTPATGTEPSIRGRQLFVPLNLWFMTQPQSAFPLLCLRQGSDLTIKVTLRPIQDLFRVRDVFDPDNAFPHIRPDFNGDQFQMYRFLQSPPNADVRIPYENTLNLWNANIHLMATYAFLGDEERKQMAANRQSYLVKDVFRYTSDNITGSKRVSLTSNGTVSSWMWYLQRNDVSMRNEWSNYTNWPYGQLPVDTAIAESESDFDYTDTSGNVIVAGLGPYLNPDGSNTGIFMSGDFAPDNRKVILATMGIVLNGANRETNHVREVYDYLTRYAGSNKIGQAGLYCYNYCLNASSSVYQPSGGINMSGFKTVELEVTVEAPPIDAQNSSFDVLCDGGGNVIATKQSNWRLNEYGYNLVIFEERYNILSFVGGQLGLTYAR